MVIFRPIFRSLCCFSVGSTALLWMPLKPLAEELISFSLPIACEVGTTCFIQNYPDNDPSQRARDYQCHDRTYDGHDGTDFRLPSLEQQQNGVDVLAAAGGIVVSARDDMPDVSIREAGLDRSADGSAAMAYCWRTAMAGSRNIVTWRATASE